MSSEGHSREEDTQQMFFFRKIIVLPLCSVKNHKVSLLERGLTLYNELGHSCQTQCLPAKYPEKM